MAARAAALLALVALAALPARARADGDGDFLEPEFRKVGCHSLVKLTHVSTGYKLHTHPVKYGSGSGQQSVTGLDHGADPSSYFEVLPALGQECARGQPVKCGSTVRLRHPPTNTHLHSHLHRAPLSGNQEVSAYDGTDTGDNWTVECLAPGAALWQREQKVKLRHADTGLYLHTAREFMFNRPIHGQLEVSAVKSGDVVWAAQEGVYFPDPSV